jgi:hypothetical protein
MSFHPDESAKGMVDALNIRLTFSLPAAYSLRLKPALEAVGGNLGK